MTDSYTWILIKAIQYQVDKKKNAKSCSNNMDVAPKNNNCKCDTRITFKISFCNQLNKTYKTLFIILLYKKRTIVPENIDFRSYAIL
jgi:hypothetical protein